MHALKLKYLEIDAPLNTLFGHFWIMTLMPHLILNAAFKPKFPVLDAALKPKSKKACLTHAL